VRFAILVLAAVVASVVTASAQGLSGNYRVNGTNLNGSRYSGTAEIAFTSGTTCRIKWVTGTVTSRGICMRKGESFVAAYSLNNVIGLVIYEIKPDGVLDGVWTIADQPGYGTDILTPMR
jgi:hypothetical protein